MTEALSTAYDVAYLDESGSEISGTKVFHPLSSDVEREIQFMEGALRAGATSYAVRLMYPGEIKAQLKAERRANGEDFRGQVFAQVVKLSGIDNVMGMITYLEAPREN